MKKREYLEFHKKCCEKMVEVTKAKNADYTGTGDDPFANFTRVESLGVCTTEQGFLTRMSDKLSRITSFAQRGFMHVKDESVEDTLLDLANYCILMAGYLKSKREHEQLSPVGKTVLAAFGGTPDEVLAGMRVQLERDVLKGLGAVDNNLNDAQKEKYFLHGSQVGEEIFRAYELGRSDQRGMEVKERAERLANSGMSSSGRFA